MILLELYFRTKKEPWYRCYECIHWFQYRIHSAGPTHSKLSKKQRMRWKTPTFWYASYWTLIPIQTTNSTSANFSITRTYTGQPSSIEATNEMLKDKLFSTHLFGGQISLFTIMSNFIYLWITSTACQSILRKISQRTYLAFIWNLTHNKCLIR